MTEVELLRNSHLIDPDLHFWGWEIPVYLFLGGVTAGLMILCGLLALRGEPGERSRWLRWMPFAAPLLLSAGMLALFLDLELKLHVYRFYMSFELTSPMSWGSWILLAIFPATLLLGVNGLSTTELTRLADWKPVAAVGLGRLLSWLRGLAAGRRSTLGWLNIVLGVALGGYTGILLGTIGARAAWASVLLGPLFLVSGLSTGAALMMLFPLAGREHRFLRRWDLGAIAVELVLLALFFIGLHTGGGAAGREAVSLFLGGAYTAPFFALVVIVGLLAPMTLEILESRRGLRQTLFAPALILLGGLSLRFLIVLAGQA